jgi:DNA polymerase-3 subunit alpha
LDFELLDYFWLSGIFLDCTGFIAEARSMGVSEVQAWICSGISSGYCLKITNIDPLMYNLLLSVS